MNRTNEEMEFGLVEVFGVRKDGFKQLGDEDDSFGTMPYDYANRVKRNWMEGKGEWTKDYSKIYFKRAQ